MHLHIAHGSLFRFTNRPTILRHVISPIDEMNQNISAVHRSTGNHEATEDSADLLAVFAWPVTWALSETGHKMLQCCVGYPGSMLESTIFDASSGRESS